MIDINECLGLTDRANHIALRAQQVNSNIHDISCEFHFGSENFFEWAIEGSSSTMDTALSTSSLKTYETFQKALLTYFTRKLTKPYATRMANVSFVSRNTRANDRMELTFRIYFLKAILDKNLRTEVVSNIQSAYYDIIRNYFVAISKSTKLPTSVKINAPTDVNISSRQITLINEKTVVYSMISNSTASLTKEMTTIAPENTSGLSDNIFVCHHIFVMIFICFIR